MLDLFGAQGHRYMQLLCVSAVRARVLVARPCRYLCIYLPGQGLLVADKVAFGLVQSAVVGVDVSRGLLISLLQFVCFREEVLS